MTNIPQWLEPFFTKNREEFQKLGKASLHKDKFFEIFERKPVEKRGDRLSYLFTPKRK